MSTDYNSPSQRPHTCDAVQFVSDVKPYELAKIRLFNGVHSYLAYYGENHGVEYIADVIEKPEINKFVQEMQDEEISPLFLCSDPNQFSTILIF